MVGARLNSLSSMSRRPLRPAVRPAAALLVVASAALMGACGDFQLAEFTRATTTTVEVEAAPTTIVEPAPTTVMTVRPARYEVQPGDSIGSIATQFGVSTAALLEANGILDANALEAGRVIVIPDPDAMTTPPWQTNGIDGRDDP